MMSKFDDEGSSNAKRNAPSHPNAVDVGKFASEVETQVVGDLLDSALQSVLGPGTPVVIRFSESVHYGIILQLIDQRDKESISEAVSTQTVGKKREPVRFVGNGAEKYCFLVQFKFDQLPVLLVRNNSIELI